MPTLHHIEKFKGLVRELWLLTADRYPTDEEIAARAESWNRIVPADIFDEYLTYTVRAVLLSRTRHGPVHADEFMQVSVKVRQMKLIYSVSEGEWISDQEFIYRYYQAKYPEAQDTPNPPESVQAAIRRMIYNWK